MQPQELRQELHALGIDEGAADVLTLLPLVLVAWSDDDVHPAERDVIVGAARERGLLSEDGARVLENWLAHRPSDPYIGRAKALLRSLAPDRGDALALAEQVARAAGGVFRRVGPPERAALEALARSLDLPPGATPPPAPTVDDWLDDEITQTRPIPVPAAPPSAGPSGLALWSGENDERVVEIGASLVVGRARDADLQLVHDCRVSRRHARFHRAGDKVYVQDLGSVNGVTVDGERVVERQLFGGETIVLGETVLRFRA